MAALIFALGGGSLIAFMNGILAKPCRPARARSAGCDRIFHRASRRLNSWPRIGLTADNLALARFQSPALLEHILKTPEYLEAPVEQTDRGGVSRPLRFYRRGGDPGDAMWAREFLRLSIAGWTRDGGAGWVRRQLHGRWGDDRVWLAGAPARQFGARAANHSVPSKRARCLAGQRRIGPDQAPLGVRIGGHRGMAVVSRLGSDRQQHIAATGDTVNVASRLLEACAQRGYAIAVSEELFAAAGLQLAPEDGEPTALVIEIRGRAQPLPVRFWR